MMTEREKRLVALGAKFVRGDRLTRREQRSLMIYMMSRILDETQHICSAVGGQQHPEEVRDAEVDDSG